MNFVNFDFHSHCAPYSECASQTLDQLIESCKNSGINLIAITNHDTIDGLELFKQKCALKNIDLIFGIEISAVVHDINLGKDYYPHIIGLYLNKNFELVDSQVKQIFEFNKEMDKQRNYYYSNVFNLNIPSSYSKKQVIDFLEKNNISKTEFKKVYNDPMFIEKYQNKYLDSRLAIDMIHQMGGVAVLAHPFKNLGTDLNDNDVNQLISKLIKEGLDGIEVLHPHTCKLNKVDYLYDLAKNKNLIFTLGSDNHHLSKNHYFNFNTSDYSKIIKEIMKNNYWKGYR